MAMIQGIQLPSGFRASLGATSPEVAAKQFMKLATQGLATVFADALLEALSETGDEDSGWRKLVKGCLLELHWETPSGTSIQVCIAIPANDQLGARDLV